MPIPELQEFRRQFPAYGDMSDGNLADSLAQKYPAYADLPGKVKAEPSLGSRIASSILPENAGRAITQQKKDIATIPSTAAGIGNTIRDSLRAGTEAVNAYLLNPTNPLRAADEYLQEKFPEASATVSRVGKSLLPDPVGATRNFIATFPEEERRTQKSASGVLGPAGKPIGTVISAARGLGLPLSFIPPAVTTPVGEVMHGMGQGVESGLKAVGIPEEIARFAGEITPDVATVAGAGILHNRMRPRSSFGTRSDFIEQARETTRTLGTLTPREVAAFESVVNRASDAHLVRALERMRDTDVRYSFYRDELARRQGETPQPRAEAPSAAPTQTRALPQPEPAIAAEPRFVETLKQDAATRTPELPPEAAPAAPLPAAVQEVQPPAPVAPTVRPITELSIDELLAQAGEAPDEIVAPQLPAQPIPERAIAENVPRPTRAAPRLEDFEIAVSTFIARQGGINIPKNLKEEFGGWNRLHKSGALAPDELAVEAHAAGLIPEPTTNALIDGLKSGRKSSRVNESAGVQAMVDQAAKEKIAEITDTPADLEYKGKTYTGAVKEGNNVRLKDDFDRVVKGTNEILKIDEKVPFDVPEESASLNQINDPITERAQEAATSPTNDLPQPTNAQKETGNYKKGHVAWQGFDVSIENPKGSIRSGKAADGTPWEVEMPAHYGYLRSTKGADKEQIDIYLGETPSDRVFVVDQIDATTGKFDEHKVVANVATLDEATQLYDAGFSDQRGPERRSAVTEMSIPEFREWVEKGKTQKAAASGAVTPQTVWYRGVKKPGEEFASQGRWTTDPSEAAGYAGTGGRVVAAHLNIKNPHSGKGNLPTVDDPIREGIEYDGLIGEPFGDKRWAAPFRGDQVDVLSEKSVGTGGILTDRPMVEQTPAGAQAIIPGAEARTIPNAPIRPTRAQTEAPLELEQPGIQTKEPGLFTSDVIEQATMAPEGGAGKSSTTSPQAEKPAGGKPEIVLDDTLSPDVGGFYDDATNKIHVSTKLSPERRAEIISHELEHARQSGKGDLPSSKYVPPDKSIKLFMEYFTDPSEVKARSAEKGEPVTETWDAVFKLREQSMKGELGKVVPLVVEKVAPVKTKKFAPDRPIPDSQLTDWHTRRLTGGLRKNDPLPIEVEKKSVRVFFENHGNGIIAESMLADAGIEAFSNAPFSVDVPITDQNLKALQSIFGNKIKSLPEPSSAPSGGAQTPKPIPSKNVSPEEIAAANEMREMLGPREAAKAKAAERLKAKQAGRVESDTATLERIAKLEKENAELAARKSAKEASEKTAGFKSAPALQRLADAMESQIQGKLNPGVSNQNPTARRARIAEGMMHEGERLATIQKQLRAVANAMEAGELPESLKGITTRADLETLSGKFYRPSVYTNHLDTILQVTKGKRGLTEDRATVARASGRRTSPGSNATILYANDLDAITRVARAAQDAKPFDAKGVLEDVAKARRMNKFGIETEEKFNQAKADLEKLTGPKEVIDPKVKKLRELESALIGMKEPGVFFTPNALAERVVESADIRPGMKVLEPSAGKGDLVDAIKAAEPSADVSAIEIRPRLQEILELKGHNVVGRDFTEYNEVGFDRIVMNPPFENGQDIAHVRHAYELLKPGGKLVAIMSEGPFFRNDKAATAFREWMDETGATAEKLPEKSFTGAGTITQTGTTTRLLEVEKPAEAKVDAIKPENTTADDQIRFLMNLNKAEIEAYSPEASIRKVGRHWSYNTVGGNSHPGLYDTRREASEAATRYKQLKADQYENPSSYYDLTSLLAGERLKKIEEYEKQGMSEMDAGKRAREEIPDPRIPSDLSNATNFELLKKGLGSQTGTVGKLTPEQSALEAQARAARKEIYRRLSDEVAKTGDKIETVAARMKLPKGMLERLQKEQESLAAEAAAVGAQPPEMPPKPPTGTEPSPSPQEWATGIKNATVDEELAALGLAPATHGQRLSFEEARAAAAQIISNDPFAGKRLVDGLVGSPRPVTAIEDAVLLHEQTRLKNERIAAEDVLIEARKSGDQTAIDEAKARVEAATAEFMTLGDVVTQVGTESSLSLGHRRMMMKADYSLAEMELAKIVANDGKPLTDRQRAEIKTLHEKIAATEKAYEDYRAKTEAARAELESELATARLAREAREDPTVNVEPHIKSFAERIVESLEAEAVRARARIRAKVSRMAAGIDPTLISDSAIVGAAKIARGVIEFPKWSRAMLDELGEWLRPHLQTIWDASNKSLDERIAAKAGQNAGRVKRAVVKPEIADRMEAVKDRILTKVESGDDISISAQAQMLARLLIERGITERNALIDAVHNELKEVVPEITRRQAMDAISGYGEYKQLSKDEISSQLRDLKGQMQQVAKLEDIYARQPPLKTGVERRAASDEERRLILQVNEAKRRLGIVITDPATQLQSALGARKTYYHNQITDLEAQIKAREKFVKQKTPSPTDPELEGLKARSSELKKEFEEVFGKPGLTDEQRVAMAIRGTERSIADLERRIETGDVGPRSKRSEVPNTPELEAARARRDALHEQLVEMRNLVTPHKTPEEVALQTLKTRLKNQTANLTERLAQGDFSAKPKRVVSLDAEAHRLHYENAKAKAEWNEGLMKDRLANRTIPQKIIGGVGEVLNTTRAILTSIDLSAVLRQGAAITFGHPIRAAKAFPAMFRALVSKQGQHRANQEILGRENYPLYKRSRLYLAEDGHTLAKMEEAYMSRWADKIPLVAGSQRAYSTFLNRLRADSFDAMARTLSRGDKLTPEEAGAISNFINVATGRGSIGMKENAMVGLNTVFFAPRYVASRFHLIAGQPLYRGNARTRLQITKEYARFLTGLGVVYGLANMTDTEIEVDPRSSDFGKIKIGNTRLDPLAGLSQVTVLVSRLATGETKTLRGRVVPIRGDNKPFGSGDSADVIARFLRSKLSPAFGTGVNILAGKNVVGEPTTPESVAANLLVPLAVQDIKEAMVEQGVPRGSALAILGFFGISMQTFDERERRRPDRSTFAQRWGMSDRAVNE